MNSLPSDSSSGSAFERLDTGIQRWVYREGWTELRDVQGDAILAISPGGCDVLVSAPTAAGKTEAAFLPLLSRALAEGKPGVRILYIGPLKALINDQFARLEGLCEELEVPVHRWHGDVAAMRKERVRDNPDGVVLITPESLEALFVNHGPRVARMFAGLEGVIEQVRVFQTRMRSLDNRVIVLPNSQITSAPIINFTGRPTRRVDLVVGVGYDDDLQAARAALIEAAASTPLVLKEPAADVLVSALGESSINLTLRAWVATSDFLTAKSDLLEAIHREIRARGLSIPYPQRDLHVYHHGTPPGGAAGLARDLVDDGGP